ncbi:MAG: hypothetical protein ACEQSK_06900 [Sphingomonadaceae bacterium]
MKIFKAVIDSFGFDGVSVVYEAYGQNGIKLSLLLEREAAALAPLDVWQGRTAPDVWQGHLSELVKPNHTYTAYITEIELEC